MMNLILLSVSVLTIAAVVSPIASATSNTAIDFFEECELGLGNTQQPYDETCPNGATNLLPCNPGQLKVAECIGQSGNTSRMCDPCPQKHYQSFYNKCTRCHQCSECSPNEEISEPCTDRTDTVCRSILPPEPDSIPQSQAPTRSTTTTTIITNLHVPTSPQSVVSTVVTYGNVDQTTEIFSPGTTAGNKATKGPPGTVIHVALSVCAVFLLIMTILFISTVIYYKRKENRRKDLSGNLEDGHIELDGRTGRPNGCNRVPRTCPDDPGQRPSSQPPCPDDPGQRPSSQLPCPGGPATGAMPRPLSPQEPVDATVNNASSGSPMSTTQSADDHIEPGGSKASPSMNLTIPPWSASTTPTPSPGGVMSHEEEIPGLKPNRCASALWQKTLNEEHEREKYHQQVP